MTQIDLIRLWTLNAIVVYQKSLDYMVWDPGRIGTNSWNFPSERALAASAEDRLSRIRDCVFAGEVAVHARIEGTSNRYSQIALERIDDQALSKTGVPCIVTITPRGHRRWEREFRPDWNRFWVWKEESHDNGDVHSYEVRCATDEMMNEVLEHFPAFRMLDADFGLKDVRRSTIFGELATFWKILPTAEHATFSASLGLQAMSVRVRESIVRCMNDPSAAFEYDSWYHGRCAEMEMAEHKLSRLSTVW